MDTPTANKRIKIFAIRMHSNILLGAMDLLREKPVDVLYWEGAKSGFDSVARAGEYKGTIFHNAFKAAQGIPADGVDASLFEPPDKELIEKLLACESQVLSMMNAIDLHKTPLSKKKHIYYEHVRYWRGVLHMLKPDAIIFGDIPHLPHHYVIYSIAHAMDIKTIMMKRIPIRGRIIFLDNIKRYKKLERKLKELVKKDFQLGHLSWDIREYYEMQTNPAVNSSPFYVKEEHIKERSSGAYPPPTVESIIRNLAQFTFFKTAIAYGKMFFRKRNLDSLEGFKHMGFTVKTKEFFWNKEKRKFKKEYEALVIPADFSKKFIYIPLQNQPECSTSAMGDIFTDQILMIKIARASIPHDWVMYVKENPIQWGAPRTQMGRYRGYYKEIAMIKNVFVIPADTSTYKLMRHAQAVATVSSTAGWEAILRGKPTLVFGDIFYKYCDGALQVSGVDSCKKAIGVICDGYKPKQENIIKFLKAVDLVSIRGFPNKKFQEGEKLNISLEDNIRNIAQGFYDELSAPME